MDAALRNELDSCISELRDIARVLDQQANEVTGSIQGMSTQKYTNALHRYAENYRRAANKLSNIR